MKPATITYTDDRTLPRPTVAALERRTYSGRVEIDGLRAEVAQLSAD